MGNFAARTYMNSREILSFETVAMYLLIRELICGEAHFKPHSLWGQLQICANTPSETGYRPDLWRFKTIIIAWKAFKNRVRCCWLSAPLKYTYNRRHNLYVFAKNIIRKPDKSTQQESKCLWILNIHIYIYSTRRRERYVWMHSRFVNKTTFWRGRHVRCSKMPKRDKKNCAQNIHTGFGGEGKKDT